MHPILQTITERSDCIQCEIISLHTKNWAHLWDAVYPQKPMHTSGCAWLHTVLPVEAWRQEDMEHLWSVVSFFFFFFFDTTDIWKWFASFLWKLGWGLFKPTSEDTHLERRFYILLFLGSTWLFPSHLLATIWILILCVCSFVHSFHQHDFHACGKANHGAGCRATRQIHVSLLRDSTLYWNQVHFFC